jgi:branched-chain amino acid transport system substrate-binding protein
MRSDTDPFRQRFSAMVPWLCAAALLLAGAARAEPLRVPVLVPVTGFLSLEGTSQRNGALLALRNPPQGVDVAYEVSDTATSLEVAVNALERALAEPNVVAVVAPMLGTQMLALLPRAEEAGVPLVTVSGTAKITEMGNPFVFRFFPGDAVVKVAHARYVVEELGRKRPAIVYQTTAYGQSGHAQLVEQFDKLGAEVVFAEGIAPTVKDMLPVLSKAMQAKPDVLVLHLHAGPTALVIKQAKTMGIDLPIVAGSAMHQPSTAALLEPAELAGVCAETGSSPVSLGPPGMNAWRDSYRAAFGDDPDAFALQQFDATMMVLNAIAAGADTPAKMREALATGRHVGLAMTYRSDGKGNMAHDAVIVCYDGASRVPKIVKRYENVDGVD